MEYDTTQEIPCTFCNAVHTVHYNRADMTKWQEGTLIQNAFPYLSANDRELLKTKICGKYWDETFEGGTNASS